VFYSWGKSYDVSGVLFPDSEFGKKIIDRVDDCVRGPEQRSTRSSEFVECLRVRRTDGCRWQDQRPISSLELPLTRLDVWVSANGDSTGKVVAELFK